jgi:hypothetical protein
MYFIEAFSVYRNKRKPCSYRNFVTVAQVGTGTPNFCVERVVFVFEVR